MATLNVDNSFPLSFAGGACGEFDGEAFSSAFNVCLPLGGDIPIEALSGILLDGVLNIESIHQLGIDKTTLIDIVQEGGITVDSSFYIEFLQGVRSDEVIPLEFDGFVLTPTILEWTLSGRGGTLFVLNTRDNTWTPVDRNTLMTLGTRLSEFKPADRGSDWSL
jgi:hypothetical protein